MKVILRILVITFILLAVYSCSHGYKHSVLNENYKKGYNDKKVLIVLLNEPFIMNDDDVIDDLGEGEPTEVFFNYLSNELPSKFKKLSNCSEVDLVFDYGNKLFNMNDKFLPDNSTITIKEPSEEYSKYNASEYEFVIFIDDLTVGRGILEEMKTTSENTLYYKGIYTLWSNNLNSSIGYGKILSETRFGLMMHESTWRASMNHLSMSLIRNSPFRNPKVNYSWDYRSY